MKSTTRILIACASLAIIAGSASAQLSVEYRDWAKGPVRSIMTAQEQQQWNQLSTDAQAKAFVDLFWARRDPTPGTPANDYRDNFDQLVSIADQTFGEGRRRGSLTDRGRVFIVLGAPTSPVKQFRSTPQSTDQPQDANRLVPSRQVWTYEAAKTKGRIEKDLEITFNDSYGNGSFTIDRGRNEANAAIQSAIQKIIVSPKMTEVPKPQAAPAVMTERQGTTLPTTPAAPAAAGIGAFKTESLKTAVEQFKSSKTNPYKSVGVTYTELLTPAGDYFVPVQLYVPKSAGLTVEQVTTFFGTLEDASGNAVAIFEEPATLSTSNGDLYFDRSLTGLKPGTYRATLGLSDKDSKPVLMTTQSIELKPLSKEQTAISRLVLAGDVHQTESAALIGAPYAFGRVKIVPKGDHTFTNRDEITYFLEIVNPGIDEGTNVPKIQVKLELAGAGTKGKPGRTISAPIADATPLPLTGAPGAGQYAIMAGIPLGDMKTPLPAGDYTLRVKVYDQVKKLSWTAEQPLKLTNAAATTTTPSSKSKE